VEYQRYTSGERRGRSHRRRRLRRRRLVALVVAVLVVAAVATAVVLVTRGGGGGSAAASPDGGAAASSGSLPGATASATPAPKPTTPPPEVWEASKAKPVRVWVGGDSMGGELGWSLGPMLEKIAGFKSILFYKESSGICRPDFYDWRDKVESVMRSDKPDAVVLMLGTNDIQGVWQDGTWIAHSDPDWMRIYQKRVTDITKAALKGGARRVYWVGMPIMQKSSSNSYMKSVNKAVQQAVAGIPGAAYIDSWDLFTDEDGKFVPSLRLADGFHFSAEGQKLISKAVLKEIKKDWLPNGVPKPPASPTASPSPSASASSI
jgi:uncharacterized protein